MSDHLLSALTDLEAQLVDAEAAASIAVRRVDALNKAIEGLREVVATLPTAQSQKLFEAPTAMPPLQPPLRRVSEVEAGWVEAELKPRGREAIRRILLEARKPMTVQEIVADLRARDWMQDLVRPAETVAVTARRLVKDGEVEVTGKRTFRYRLDKLPPQTTDEPRPAEESRQGDEEMNSPPAATRKGPGRGATPKGE